MTHSEKKHKNPKPIFSHFSQGSRPPLLTFFFFENQPSCSLRFQFLALKPPAPLSKQPTHTPPSHFSSHSRRPKTSPPPDLHRPQPPRPARPASSPSSSSPSDGHPPLAQPLPFSSTETEQQRHQQRLLLPQQTIAARSTDNCSRRSSIFNRRQTHGLPLQQQVPFLLRLPIGQQPR